MNSWIRTEFIVLKMTAPVELRIEGVGSIAGLGDVTLMAKAGTLPTDSPGKLL